MSRNERATGDPATARSDWPEIRRRPENASAQSARGTTQSVEEKERILRARAAALARPREEDARPEEQLEVLEFLLVHERYAIASSWVREVCPLRDLTPLPGTPPFVRGIVNLRGQIVSVVDLKRFFDLPEKGLTDLSKVIVIGDGQTEFGLLADGVAGVRSIALLEIQPPLPTLTGVREAYLKGVTKERLVILDGAAILADPKLIVRDDTKS
jgi:purine-binding chemotaxis protein CheW